MSTKYFDTNYPPPPEFRIPPPPSPFYTNCDLPSDDSTFKKNLFPLTLKAVNDVTSFELCPNFFYRGYSNQINAIQVKKVVSVNRSRAGAIQSFYERQLLKDWLRGNGKIFTMDQPIQKPEIINIHHPKEIDEISKTTTFWITLIVSSLLLASLIFIVAIASYYIRKRTVGKRNNAYIQTQTSQDVLKRYGLSADPRDNQECSKTLLGYANEHCKILPVVKIHENIHNKHKNRAKLIPCLNADDHTSDITDKFYYYNVGAYNNHEGQGHFIQSHLSKRQYQTMANDQAELYYNNYNKSPFHSRSSDTSNYLSLSFNDKVKEKNQSTKEKRKVTIMRTNLLDHHNLDFPIGNKNLQHCNYSAQCQHDNHLFVKGVVGKNFHLNSTLTYSTKNVNEHIQDDIFNKEQRVKTKKHEVMRLHNSYDVNNCFVNLSKVYSPICLSFDGTKFISHIYTDIDELNVNN